LVPRLGKLMGIVSLLLLARGTLLARMYLLEFLLGRVLLEPVLQMLALSLVPPC
jgi:hypothetical protein